MTITISQGEVPRAAAPQFDQLQYEDARNAIANLGYADIWRDAAGTVVENDRVHLDVQGRTADGRANLQVQLKGIARPNTVAAALVAPSAVAIDPATNRQRSLEQQREIERSVRHALLSSLDDYRAGDAHIWVVEGSPSS
ncbi:hypothetical protein [Micromonospora radicis]|uniref:Uncharacterized protein n=1 Tax=Micromonospora radicis TaxID=1894971 RepID=A0A418MNV5_9ACTN|nr:hypothetical protein [Micromonospora radicis]RIV32719.1 hypothetical protein D2L64_24450 [Micromonospora radicis]